MAGFGDKLIFLLNMWFPLTSQTHYEEDLKSSFKISAQNSIILF